MRFQCRTCNEPRHAGKDQSPVTAFISSYLRKRNRENVYFKKLHYFHWNTRITVQVPFTPDPVSFNSLIALVSLAPFEEFSPYPASRSIMTNKARHGGRSRPELGSVRPIRNVLALIALVSLAPYTGLINYHHTRHQGPLRPTKPVMVVVRDRN